MNIDSLKGYTLAAVAAAAYGTNPAFAVPLYAEGMNPVSVLLFRYVMGLPLLALIMKVRRVGFRLNRGEAGLTAVLGILMALSSLALFESYNHMNSGIASTLLFVYPVMVAVMMMFFFHEPFKPVIGLCLVIMGGGLALLMKPQQGAEVSSFGCLLVMMSALTYALYIVMVNVSKTVSRIPTTKLLFYVLAWGSLTYAAIIPLGPGLTIPAKGAEWSALTALALIPTVISLACTSGAIRLIGSTPTAIFGALEPVTAVVLSVIFLGQTITGRDILGATLIVVAATLVVAATHIERALLHVRKFFPRPRKPSS
ncbi:MAG: DMT family transporter [Bacteroidales bacterium]|nr:DMT family transporter [Bacteroidales bacterium]